MVIPLTLSFKECVYRLPTCWKEVPVYQNIDKKITSNKSIALGNHLCWTIAGILHFLLNGSFAPLVTACWCCFQICLETSENMGQMFETLSNNHWMSHLSAVDLFWAPTLILLFLIVRCFICVTVTLSCVPCPVVQVFCFYWTFMLCFVMVVISLCLFFPLVYNND